MTGQERLRVLLCYPSILPGHKPTYGLQPLGILYIAAVLREHGFAVCVLDADVDGLTCAEMAERILAWQPDLVGLSLMTPQLLPALQTAALLKQARPSLRIVLGGAHIDSTHDDVFTMSDDFDFAIYNEGEHALLAVVEKLAAGATLIEAVEGAGNVIHRDSNGRVVKNAPLPFLPDLGVLPSVDYDMVDVRKYSLPTASGPYVISMMLSRGCPFRCTFCDAPITMGKKIRFWPVERLVEDIRRYSQRYACRDFVFKDSTFSANRRWTEDFCDALIEARLRIRWRCNTRANLVPQPLLEKMARAGCHTINFGVESGDPEVLRRIEKEVDIEDVVDAFARCRALSIHTYATFMVGNPGESEQSVRATIALARRIRPTLAAFAICKAYPGTPLYEEAVREGLTEPRWWAKQKWDPHRHSAFEARWQLTSDGSLSIPGFDAEAWQRRATREFYLRVGFVADTVRQIGREPRFLAHVLALAREWLPSLVQWNHRDPARGARCPSLPEAEYRAS